MNKKTVLMETSVGLFAVAVFAILFIFTVVLSRDALFRSSTTMRFAFQDVMGLRVGDNVVSRGVTVGKVDDIAFTEDAVLVTALLTTPVYLREDFRAEVVSSSLLGGRNLLLTEGTPSAPLLPPEATTAPHAPPSPARIPPNSSTPPRAPSRTSASPSTTASSTTSRPPSRPCAPSARTSSPAKAPWASS